MFEIRDYNAARERVVKVKVRLRIILFNSDGYLGIRNTRKPGNVIRNVTNGETDRYRVVDIHMYIIIREIIRTRFDLLP